MIDRRRSLSRGKYQRDVNKFVRVWNKLIEEDWLWNGRFYLRQQQASFQPYEDHSGASFDVLLQLIDRKTGRSQTKWFDNYTITSHLGYWINDCLVEQWRVWDENPNPQEQAKIEGRRPSNFYMLGQLNWLEPTTYNRQIRVQISILAPEEQEIWNISIRGYGILEKQMLQKYLYKHSLP